MSDPDPTDSADAPNETTDSDDVTPDTTERTGDGTTGSAERTGDGTDESTGATGETADPAEGTVGSTGEGATNPGEATEETANAGPADEDATAGVSGSNLVTYVEYATFGILCLLALVATFRFYFAASEAIRVWFSSDFVPVFQAAFNLVVLVAAALGVSVLVRRIGSTD